MPEAASWIAQLPTEKLRELAERLKQKKRETASPDAGAAGRPSHQGADAPAGNPAGGDSDGQGKAGSSGAATDLASPAGQDLAGGRAVALPAPPILPVP